MNTQDNTSQVVEQTTEAAAPAAELDFFSDEPLPVCPLRNEGSVECEVCQ